MSFSLHFGVLTSGADDSNISVCQTVALKLEDTCLIWQPGDCVDSEEGGGGRGLRNVSSQGFQRAHFAWAFLHESQPDKL